MRVQVVFDNRERMDLAKVAADTLEQHGLEIHFQDAQDAQGTQDADLPAVFQAALGDILFVDADSRRVLMLVERKGVQDFVASLQPGHLCSKRLTEQLDRMGESGVPRLGLLLTGAYHELDAALQKALVTKTVRLQHSGVMVTRLESLQHLPLYIARTVEGLQSLPRAQAEAAPDFHTLMVAVRKKRVTTPSEVYHTLLQLIPGVSEDAARVIAAEFKSLSALQAACRADGAGAITKLKHRKRAINKTSAGIIAAALQE